MQRRQESPGSGRSCGPTTGPPPGWPGGPEWAVAGSAPTPGTGPCPILTRACSDSRRRRPTARPDRVPVFTPVAVPRHRAANFHAMKLGMAIEYARDPLGQLASVPELEKAGLDMVWVAEAYGLDAVSVMGYLAAITERVEIAAGILPIYTRTPALIAQTAVGLDTLTGGRFVLGLGASGPQVIEGWHGVPYHRPLQTTRELIEICRKV